MRLIDVNNVSKVFKPRRGTGRLLTKGGFIGLFRNRSEPVVALQDVSFTVDHGEAVGIIGANGSGKSTLLKLLAGVSVPTSGSIQISGRVASLLELGAGFHPLLTGRENVYLNARILGVRKAQVNEVFDKIVDFSGIADFLDNPVSTYSSGMYVRLGFAVAVHVNPDIFLVDEVLSVGDEEFQRKCRTRIGELREQGKTIIFVSHDLSIVNTLCDRVILLSKGRTISRGTPRETIDFYLRQIGRDIGIHTFSEGGAEAIMCHGRISLFHNKKEITAAAGLAMRFQCMGQYHDSTLAEWVVEERGPNYCKARGKMARLPLVLLWEMRIENGRFIWRIGFHCEHEFELQLAAADVYLPVAYAKWHYGENAGSFPNILPEDLSWLPVMNPDPQCRETLAFGDDSDSTLPLVFRLDARNPFLMLTWSNTEYVSGSRVLQAVASMPEVAKTQPRGDQEFGTLEIDLGLEAGKAAEYSRRLREHAEVLRRERESHRTVLSGDLSALFTNGTIVIRHKRQEITAFTHFYSSILIGGLWNDSHSFHWQDCGFDGNKLVATGESRRFPYMEHWEMEPVPEGIAVAIWIEPRERIDLDEYHASIVLKPEYTRWETEFESGEYPPFEPGLNDWRHANRLYKIGTRATALSSTLPSVTLRVTSAGLPFRMTAINTGYFENARVLQALRTAETGRLFFEKGRHLYFAGIISVDPEKKVCEKEK